MNEEKENMPNVFNKYSSSFGKASGNSLQGIKEFENEDVSEVVYRFSQIFIKPDLVEKSPAFIVETIPKLNASRKRKARDFHESSA